MAFDADWLAARAPYDEAALDRSAVDAIRAWGARLPPGYAPIVVDLGSGTGVALDRVRRWLAPRPVVAFAVDQDAALLGRIAPPDDGSRIVPIDLQSSAKLAEGGSNAAGSAARGVQTSHSSRGVAM